MGNRSRSRLSFAALAAAICGLIAPSIACDDSAPECPSCRVAPEPEPDVIVIFGPESEPDETNPFEPDSFEPDSFEPDSFEPDFPFEIGPIWPTVDGPITDGPCEAECEGIDSFEGTAVQASRCYACQCKRAFDDWLPSAEQIQCGVGETIPHFTRDSGLLEEVPLNESPAQCANPSLFQDDCSPGARYGRVVNGDVDVRFLCRRIDQSNLSVPYSLVGVIGQNTRTGATCFWDALGDTIGDDNFPDLDVSDASEEEIERFTEKIGTLGGAGCFECHGADPFVYTPFLQGVDAPTGPWVFGPYTEVVLNNEHRAVPYQHLVSPEVEACTACHRIAQGAGCVLFALDAVGDSVLTAKEAQSYPNDRWMPHDFAGLEDETAWNDIYSMARDHLNDCCFEGPESTNSNCQWAPIPAQ